MQRRTKIVATIGPASERPETVRSMIDAGMDVARLSLSHSSLDEVLAHIAIVRQASADAGREVGVLADLPGPKIRAAEFPDGGVHIAERTTVELVDGGDGDRSSEGRIVIDHPGATAELQTGDRVALGDGAIQLRVDTVAAGRVSTEVIAGGWAQGRPGVALPASRIRLESPTAEDLRLLRALGDTDVESVAISFVRSAADVDRARVAAGAGGPMLVAKIETGEAIGDLDRIIATADGVMVARGDLGIRCAVEDVPHHQKRIIRTGVAFGRPVITATQMLESMLRAPVPTRAEVSDVANAVFDGTSALMLSGETAIGDDPVAAVGTMARIASRAEREFDYEAWGRSLGRQQAAEVQGGPAGPRITAAISAAAWRAAIEAEVSAVIACTNTGATARAIARFRPRVPLLAATPSVRTARWLALAWGVTPMLTARHGTTDDIVWFAVKTAVEEGHIRTGDVVAVLAGAPTHPDAATDTLRLVRIE